MTSQRRHFSTSLLSIASLTASLLFTSCEETIDLDLDQARERIVIEGIVSNKPSVSGVRISFTENIYKRSASKKAGGAVVSLSDDLGNSEVLREVQPGVFAPAAMLGAVNREYRLKVSFEGSDYFAVSRMPEAMALDSVRAFTTTSGFFPFFTRSISLTYYVTNKAGVEEFCIIRAFNPNDGSKPSWSLYSDRNTDGRQTVLEGASLSTSASSVRVEIISIDKATYDYFRALEDIIGHDGFDVPDLLQMNEYNPTSNITNDALGYFSAQSQREYVVNLR